MGTTTRTVRDRQRKALYESRATREEALAAAYVARANATQARLDDRRHQLELARNAQRRCLAVTSGEVALVGELGRYATALGTALSADSVGKALGDLGNGCVDLARQASMAAQELVGRLRAECDALVGEVGGLRSQAAGARARAASYRSQARHL